MHVAQQLLDVSRFYMVLHYGHSIHGGLAMLRTSGKNDSELIPISTCSLV